MRPTVLISSAALALLFAGCGKKDDKNIQGTWQVTSVDFPADIPSDDRTWKQGTTFYHYDQIYDSRDVGYRGPAFSYSRMPDQKFSVPMTPRSM